MWFPSWRFTCAVSRPGLRTGLIRCAARPGLRAGFYGTEDRFALQPARDKELTVHLVSGWSPERMDRTLELIRDGHLHTLPLITHHFPVEDAAAAWRLILRKSAPVLGVILDWEQESR